MKKNLKTACLLVALTVAGHANAQNENVFESNGDKYKVETNQFWSNWFIKAGGGAQVYLGDDDSKASFGKRISPALDLSVGKWFTPGLGLQLTYSGLSSKGVSYIDGSYTSGSKNSKGLYEQKWNNMYLHGDILFNLTNMFCGYKDTRVYSAIPYVGFGWLRSYDRPRNNEFAANVGFINRFRLSNHWDFNLEARAMLTKDEFDSQIGGKNYEGMVSVLAGFTYKFSATGWNRSKVRTVSTGISAEEMDRIQAKLREQQDRSRQLENDLQAALNKKAETVVEKQFAVAPHVVLFGLGSSTVTKDGIINLDYLAKAIKATDKAFTVCGYADSATGTASINEKLSKERAEAVRNILVNDFNVPASQLKVEHKGGVGNMFYNDSKLSRVVIVE